MKHQQTITPIKTNRNKFNSSSPFRVIFSGTFNRNVYYDLSSAYLKMKIRCRPNEMKTIKKVTGDDKDDQIVTYTGNFFIPVLNNTPVDYIQGFFSIFDDNGAELKFELNNINNEEQANHTAMIEFIDKYPNEFEYNRHIRKLFAGHKGFETRYPMYNMRNYSQHDHFEILKSFDNKYEFVKEGDYWYTTMYIPFTQVLEPATRMSLLRIYSAEFDIFFKDCFKFFNVSRPHVPITKNSSGKSKGECNNRSFGEPWITISDNGQSLDMEPQFNSNTAMLFENDGNFTFFEELPEIVDCDLYMDQYTIESMEEMHQLGDKYFMPVLYQLDNHVFDLSEDIDIHKYKIECPFKPSACYYYFTRDDDNNKALRTDYLYLNPPKYCVLKTLTGQSTPYPNYENNENVDIIDSLDYVYNYKEDGSVLINVYSQPDERLYNELLYNLKKFDHPIIDHEMWLRVHRIYSIDCNSDLNLGEDKNTFFFEIQLEHDIDSNTKLHVIFIRDY